MYRPLLPKMIFSLFFTFLFLLIPNLLYALELEVKIIPESLKTEKIILEIKVPKYYVVTKVEYKLTNLDDSSLYQKFSDTKIKQKSLQVFYIEMNRRNFDPADYVADLVITTNHIRIAAWTSKLTRPQTNPAYVKFTVPAIGDD